MTLVTKHTPETTKSIDQQSSGIKFAHRKHSAKICENIDL